MLLLIGGAVIGFIVCAFVYANNNSQATKIVDKVNEEIDKKVKAIENKVDGVKKIVDGVKDVTNRQTAILGDVRIAQAKISEPKPEQKIQTKKVLPTQKSSKAKK